MPEFDCTLEYRDVIGFPGYKVGNDGSVWSCRRYRGSTAWRLLKPQTNIGGYAVVKLGPGRKWHLVNRLVLIAFVGPCPEGMQTRHFPDSNPQNNSLRNLCWGTPTANQADRVYHDTHRRGERSHFAILTADDVKAIRDELASGHRNAAAIARRYNVSHGCILAISHRKTWHHIH